MTDFRCKYGECPPIPDDLTIPQFLLDYYHPERPLRPKACPWLIEDGTGRTIFYEEVGHLSLQQKAANSSSFRSE